jgi:hypothetical protein
VVEGGRENNVWEKYVSAVDPSDQARSREVNGRCKVPFCPCFIRDCGHVQPGDNVDSTKGGSVGQSREGVVEDISSAPPRIHHHPIRGTQLPTKSQTKRRQLTSVSLAKTDTICESSDYFSSDDDRNFNNDDGDDDAIGCGGGDDDDDDDDDDVQMNLHTTILRSQQQFLPRNFKTVSRHSVISNSFTTLPILLKILSTRKFNQTLFFT